MTATTVPTATADRGSAQAVAGLVTRQSRRGASIVLVVTAGLSGLIAATYDSVMSDPAARAGLDAIASDPAIRMLFGEPQALGTSGGFTVWRVGTVTTVLLGVWSILAGTRILRAEEETRRRDLLLGGCVPARTVAVWSLAVLALAPVVTGLAVAAVMAAAGTGPAGAFVHGVGVGLLGLFFLATAGVSAQLFATRAAATGAAVAVLGAGLLARMLGDGVDRLSWLHWGSPFGLLALSSPYMHNRVLPLVLLLISIPVLGGLAVLMIGHRDVGEGLIARPTSRPAHLAMLSSVEAFALRRCIRAMLAWSAGVAAYFLLIGLSMRSMIDFIAGNPDVAELAAKAGFAGLRTAEGFSASVFALLPLPVSLFATARLAAFVTAESDRRLSLLTSLPLGRTRLLGAEIAATITGMLAILTAAALATWMGVTATGGGLSAPAALAGTWNTMPVALLGLGAATLATGCTPQAVTLIGSVPVIGGFLLQVLTENIGASAWIQQLSPFAHLAAVPLESFSLVHTFTTVGVAALLMVCGLAGYRRRDLAG